MTINTEAETVNLNTKKIFVPLVHFLEKNKNKKVSSLFEEILKMTETKVQQSTSVSDDKGNVIAIYCYYHKQWELVKNVEYGQKASSATGLNTMCKIGVSKWTKQNNAIKKIGNTILALLESGDIDATEIASTKERLMAEAKQIDDEDKPEGFETSEDAVAAS